jgi:hypothetical protein
MLPTVDAEGLLPEGEYTLSIDELRESMLVLGPGGNYTNWDSKWRRHMVDNLDILVKQLRQVRISSSICIGGSFVEDRVRPYDIDGYFYCDIERFFISGRLRDSLNKLDPHKAWDWSPKSRRQDLRGKLQSPLWHHYNVDLFPNIGQPTGCFDEHGQDRNFYSLMRWSERVKRIRGVVLIGGSS